jgi:DNA-binding CsgD family transcriptional regulator
MRLLGRNAECEALDRLVSGAVNGRSGVVVLRGEAGIGKSVLLAHVADRAQGMRLVRVVGVESEMELAYNGLHQLCAPMLEHLDRLAQPQRVALATVFGLTIGPAPDRFLVGLATLTLLAEVAEEKPLICLVDDGQWLDRASAQVLGFVARRLLAERVAIVVSVRTGIGDEVLAGLPAISIGGLDDSDALALLLENLPGPLDAAVSRRIVAESHGNPLALVGFPRTWRVAELAGGFGFPDGRPVARRIEESYRRRLHGLPAETQLLVLAAAAEPSGDPVLLKRAAERLHIDMAAAEAAVDAGLLSIRGRAEFAHPLVRSCAYHSAAAHDRHRVHRALAEATDAEIDPDRRAWHRARAAVGPDEEVAAELERSAGRAQARGGMAAAAAFLRRAVELTEDPAQRVERAVGAADASFQSGAFDDVLGLLAIAQAEALDGFQRARVDLLLARLAWASGLGGDACPRLLQAARRLEDFDLELARETYLIAWFAAAVVAHRDGDDVMLEICRSVQALPRPQGAAHPLHLLLDGLTLLTTDGYAAATPVLQRAAAQLMHISPDDVRRWGWTAPAASSIVWDDEGLLGISTRNLRIVRDAGAFAELPQHLLSFGLARMWVGDFEEVEAVMAETEGIEAATGRFGGYLLPLLRSLQGREAEATALITSVIEQATTPGREAEAAPAHWAAAILSNGLARYDDARAAAQRAASNPFDPWFPTWALAELVEAAARGGDAALARDALDRLATRTAPAGTDFALGIEARCRALLTEGDRADVLYRDAIERLERRRLGPDQSRAHLLYGEWLRREGRRVEAREHLRTAYDLFVAIGMEGFAARAQRELVATGEKVRKRTPETRHALTPQEEQIARLARDGLSNAEIGAQLFISAKTVEWHLGNVFTKLGITSRRQLRAVLHQERPLVGGS